MANYTIELKDVIATGRNIFDFPYEFFDENKRAEFEQRFIRHFYFREIGSETIDRFKFHLRDKMDTVFPYYNKLFETARIEYSVLDNYNMTESTTTTRENSAKSNGVSHSVGQIFETQTDETEETRNATSEGTTSETVNGNSETTRNGTSDTSEKVTGKSNTVEEGEHSTNTESSETVATEQTDKKRFLDTPQGAVDLENSKYLTTLNHDTADGTKTTNGNGTENGTTKTENNGTTEKNGEVNTTTTETVTATEGKTANGDTTGKENFEGLAKGSMKREQMDTADNNTRLESVGNQVEKIEHHRRGNIGVDTDADMIQKHIKLQKVLQKIELMFFDECEDLFMLVY